MNAQKYLSSRLGRVNEKIKMTYVAGKRIVVLVTSELDFVKELVAMGSVLPINAEYDRESNTKLIRLEITTNPSFIASAISSSSITTPLVYLYTGITFPNEALVNYVTHCTGLSIIGENSNSNSFRALRQSLIIIVTPEEPKEMPIEIEAYTEIVTVPFVSEDEFKEIVSKWLLTNENLVLKANSKGYLLIADDVYLNRLFHNMRGMSPAQIIATLAKNKAELGRVYYSSMNQTDEKSMRYLLRSIRQDSERIISRSSALTLIDTASVDIPAGLEVIYQWLIKNKRRIATPQDFKKYVMTPPKGILVSGIPGSGKSMLARYIASQLGLSLIRLDIGDAMGRYVGDSEKGLRIALEVAEALSPCVLWVDEMEKAFEGGHEVTRRMIGKLLTWMQEKGDRGISCFMFATANDISKMPPEMFRSGRFDEKFFTFMPSETDCATIFASNIKRQCEKYALRSDSSATLRPLFDISEINEKMMCKLLNDSICLKNEIKTDDTKYSRENKFFTGADIAHLIESAKTIYINDNISTTGNTVFESDNFFSCLKKACTEMRTYGETNLREIAFCFSQLAANNFIGASTETIIPFSGYDEVRYSIKCRERNKNHDVVPNLYQLEDEHTHICNKCKTDYNRQLYLAVRNAVNQLAEEIIKSNN